MSSEGHSFIKWHCWDGMQWQQDGLKKSGDHTVLTVLLCCFSVPKLCPTLCEPWTAACQSRLSSTISQSLLKLMSVELVMLSNHLILCCLLLLLFSVFPSIRVFSNELALHIRQLKYWSFSFNISPSNEYSGLISFQID